MIADLQDTIRSRQKILGDFEQSVLKIIQPGVASERSAVAQSIKKEETKPVFKEGVAGEFYNLVKDYFTANDQSHLNNLLSKETELPRPLVFRGNGNQLADAFKQLFEANLIIGCNKLQLITWMMERFQFADKGSVRSYSEKYLLDIISSNTKTCQSPILNVRKKEGQFMILPLQRNHRR